MKKVCILFGGVSPEHEVSIMSATNVFNAIDKNKYNTSLVYISKAGEFQKVENINNLNNLEKFDIGEFKNFDVVFPVMHGPSCEDGSIQGFLKTLNTKYVGPNILSSAVCMDKDIQKQIARQSGIQVTDWLAVKKFEYADRKNEIKVTIENSFKYPVFVKPANMGSSVGVVKVKSENELEDAVQQAFNYDNKIIIEKAVLGREIEVAVLGKENNLKISNPGEVVSMGPHEFYDYEAKYTDATGSKTFIPAPNIGAEKIEEFKIISKKVFTILECSGLSRIDYFLTDTGEIILNEVNTLPGFTNISMYPKLMENLGINYADLISELIEL
jgi:D-alanine-D-alanine ligase